MRVAVATEASAPHFAVDASPGVSGFVTNPGHRLASDRANGHIYSLFQRRIKLAADGVSQNIDYMLNRSTDGGKSWGLNGSTTGIVVANADSTQPTPKFCTVNALLGGVDHAAVDPKTGDLYYVYGTKDAVTGNNRLAIRRLVDDGKGGLQIGDERFVTGQVQAAIPQVAIRDDGTIGVFFYTCDGISSTGFPQFTAHFSLSSDHGASFNDMTLATFLSPAKDNGNPRQRVLGDYMQTKALKDTYYGSFSANGAVFGNPVAQIDPIFFEISDND